MKTLYLLRGLPGAGKTTLASKLADKCVCADDYEGLYANETFHPELLGQAHKWCQNICSYYMDAEAPEIAIHNTLTTEMELMPYMKMANEHDYKVVSLIVENRHCSESVHSVPEQTIENMRNRFSIEL